ncbi:MAG TPA: FmdB family zinc ribbon protein [Acidobacteriota bacterium]|nr:FmdB family zinc ribbon protein [Acidobacteriota bacterium]
MPIYEYECRACGERTEVLQKAKDKPLACCPKCGGAVAKLISSPAIQFKGNGWYITDYAKKSSPAEERKSEAKTESKGEPKAGPKAGPSEAVKKKPEKADKSGS